MVYMSYDPFRNMRTFHRELTPSKGQPQEISVAVDIREEEDQVVLLADLPGVDKESIQINLDKGLLTISGERKLTGSSNPDRYNRQERQHGSFSRSFRLGDEMVSDKIAASYKGGVLELSLPKAPESKPRKIPIMVH
jgi:HSP20 family protein